MEQQVYRDIIEEMADGAYFVDRDRRITYWSAGAERITGYRAEEVVGSSCSEGILRHVTEKGHQLCLNGCPLAAVMEDGKVRAASVFLHHKDGHRVPVAVKGMPIHDSAGAIVGSVELFHPRNATPFANLEGNHRAADAYTDTLTGIGNRRFGERTLEPLLPAVSAGLTTLGLMFIDVDHFKSVNDTFGHRTGDDVLRMVGQNLANGLRATDFPIRWGGEEFVALMPGADQKGLAMAAERLRMLVQHSWIQKGEEQVRVTISIGAVLAGAEESAVEVLDRADRLMYVSKTSGRNLVTTESGTMPRGGEKPLTGTGLPWEMEDVDVTW